MTNDILTISISVNRKLRTSGCLFHPRENCRAKKRLATCGHLSPVSVKVLEMSDTEKARELYIMFVFHLNPSAAAARFSLQSSEKFDFSLLD